LEFRLLGPLEVGRADGPVPVRGPKQRALLALLLLHANEAVSRERLIDQLWGEHPPATAPKALQVYVSQLRKLLEPERLLETTSNGYVLRLEPGRLDLDRFETLLAEGRSALEGGAPRQAANLLAEALSLWRGPPLADLAYEPFAQTEIARLEELRLAATEEQIEAELRLGHHTEITGELEALVTEHPLREHLRTQLMRALYRSGRQAEALETYQEGRRLLVDELGIDPGRELRELEQAILRQDPVLDLAATPARAAVRTAGMFVGRERELEELLAGLEEALAGRGGLCLIAGEPGIGKSRLTEELLARARERGAEVLVGRCWEAGGAPAYWPWMQALRACVQAREPAQLRGELGAGAPDLAQLVPDLRTRFPDLPEREAPDSDSARFRLFDAVAAFLTAAARPRPLVLALDDMHAADEPSLLLLRFLAREIGQSRLFVVVAYRDVDPTVAEPLALTLAELRREPVMQRIALEGLSEHAVAEYIEATGGSVPSRALVDAIHAETEGNPLFVGEMVRLLVEEGRLDAEAVDSLRVPEGIREVIERRLRHLSRECFELLMVACALGREFDLSALAALSGTPSDDLLGVLDEAIAARVVSTLPGVPGRMRFEHALIRDTAYDSLAAARRAQLHHRIGETLEELYSADLEPHLAELAYHFFAALPVGETERAKAYAIRAAEWSVGQLAFEEAARLYEMALTLAGDEVQRCDVLLALGDACARAGDTSAAKRSFRDAAELADAHGLPEQLGRAAVGYGGRIIWAVSRDDDQLLSLIERALEALGDEAPELRVELLARLAAGPLRDASFPPELQQARGEEAVAIARRLGDPKLLAHALAGYTQSHLAPDLYVDLLPASEEWLAVALAAGDKERAVEAHEQLFLQLLGLGDGDRARASLREMRRIAAELRQPAQLWVVTVHETLLALLEGRFADAQRLLDQSEELGQAAPRWNAEMSRRLQLYLLRRGQGRLDELAVTQEAAPEALTFRTYPIADCVRARLYDELGRKDDSARIFSNLAKDDFAQIPFDEEWLVGMGLLAEVAHSRRDRPRAQVLLDQLAPYSSQVAVAYPEISIGSVARYLGLLASMLARWEDAERYFEDALGMNERIGARPWLAHTQEDYARTLLARGRSGDEERAAELLEQAHASYRELGMTSYAAA
jgi:DNA-binding SARP family transcriptional activator